MYIINKSFHQHRVLSPEPDPEADASAQKECRPGHLLTPESHFAKPD